MMAVTSNETNPAPERIDYESLVDEVPVDDWLLMDLGRLAWAANQLRNRVLTGLLELGDDPDFDASELSLGQILGRLRELADKLPGGTGSDLSRWCRGETRAAVQSRVGVLRKVPYLNDDEQGAAKVEAAYQLSEGLQESLREVAGRLVEASRIMPTIPRADGAGSPSRLA